MTVRFDLISVIGKLHMFVQINGIRVHFLCDKCLVWSISALVLEKV